MTKEVLLTIRGLQFLPEEEGEPEALEVITPADYYKKNDKHYLTYEEVAEGFAGSTKNIIKIGNGTLDITKRGITNTHLTFQENKKNLTFYYTPMGSLQVGIDAKEIQVKETEDNIDVNVNYNLEFNYELISNCNIFMNIKSKEAKDFRLQ